MFDFRLPLTSLFLVLSINILCCFSNPVEAVAQNGENYLFERNPFQPSEGFVETLMLEHVNPDVATVSWQFAEVSLEKIVATGATLSWKLSEPAQGYLLHCMEPCDVLDLQDKTVKAT